MQPSPHFNGADYQPQRDDPRLLSQHEKVKAFMLSGRPHTLQEIADAIDEPAASISAQLRHLRKPRFGGWIVDRQYLGDGLYSYSMRAAPKLAPKQLVLI